MELEGYFDRGRCFSLSLSTFHFVFLPSFSSFILCYEGNRIEEERNEFTPPLIVACFHFSFSPVVK